MSEFGVRMIAGRNTFDETIMIAAKKKSVDANYVARSIEWIEVENGAITAPTFDIDATAAQVLMDSLWDCGIRPTAAAGSAGQLAAVQYHLEDMRRIALSKVLS